MTVSPIASRRMLWRPRANLRTLYGVRTVFARFVRRTRSAVSSGPVLLYVVETLPLPPPDRLVVPRHHLRVRVDQVDRARAREEVRGARDVLARLGRRGQQAVEGREGVQRAPVQVAAETA